MKDTTGYVKILLICLAVAFVMNMSLLLSAISSHHNLTTFERAIYQRCLERQQYDAAAVASRKGIIQYLETVRGSEGSNKFIDKSLRDERVGAANRAILTQREANRKVVKSSCQQYKP